MSGPLSNFTFSTLGGPVQARTPSGDVHIRKMIGLPRRVASKVPQTAQLTSSDPVIIDACDQGFYTLIAHIRSKKEISCPLDVPITSLPQLSRTSVETNARYSRLMLAKRRDLYKHQNALAPIHKLPPELLAHIFYDTLNVRTVLDILASPIGVDPGYHAEYMRILWDIARVCTHWKHVVTSSPRLWAHATANDPLDLMMRKAKATPFTIRFFPSSMRPSRQEKLQGICTNAQRLRSLVVVDHDLQDVVRSLAQPLPLLEELCLCSASGLQETSSTFRGGQNLLVIHLQGVSFRWADADISNVTVLGIQAVKETPTFCEDLVTALVLSPRLQELVLSTISATGVPEETTGSAQILLPSLKRLRIESSGISQLPSLIFGNVEAPNLQNLRIAVQEGADLHTTGHVRFFGLQGGFKYFSTIVTNTPRCDKLRIMCSDSSFVVSSSRDGTLAVAIPSGSSHMGAILVSLRVLHLPVELDLALWGPRELSTAFIPTTNTLTKLTVKVNPNPALVDDILTVLARPNHRSQDGPAWPCPSLVHLHIQGAFQQYAPHSSSGTSQAACPNMDKIEEILRIRACQMFLQTKGRNSSGPAEDREQDDSTVQRSSNPVPNLVIHSEPHGQEFSAANVHFTVQCMQ
ncbi:hypothetical protein FRB99_008552 [Tulasnella sp. 403]|nr:hypothetical protein FRB99_008552 [Tulasnella sp. 403]